MLKTNLVFVLLITCLHCFSQQYNRHPSLLGMEFTLNKFSKNYIVNENVGLAMNFLKGISQRLDGTISFHGFFADSIHFSDRLPGNKKLLAELSAAMRTRLFTVNHSFQPFLEAGTGLFNFSAMPGIMAFAGPGFEIKLKDVYLGGSCQLRWLSGTSVPHSYFSLGIAGILKNSLRQKKKSKPTFPPPINLPPSDPVRLYISDTAGTSLSSALPSNTDTDGDGIPDQTDACPYTPGIIKYNGCPVPDTDGDGINDEEDSCLQVPGIVENHGCPILIKGDSQQLFAAAASIHFMTGSFRLDSGSYRFLKTIDSILRKYPYLHILVEGHTDIIITKNRT